PSTQARTLAAAYRVIGIQELYGQNGVGSLDDLKQHLASGDPFVMSIPLYFPGIRIVGWDIAIPTKTPTVIDTPSASDLLVVDYAHAVTVVGYDDNTQRFKFVNSWGIDWGEDGYGYLTYAFVREFAYFAVAM